MEKINGMTIRIVEGAFAYVGNDKGSCETAVNIFSKIPEEMRGSITIEIVVGDEKRGENIFARETTIEFYNEILGKGFGNCQLTEYNYDPKAKGNEHEQAYNLTLKDLDGKMHGEQDSNDVTPCEKHEYGERTVVQAANCAQEGVTISICSICQFEMRETTPKDLSTHNKELKDQVIRVATCEEDGLIQTVCALCNISYGTPKITKATGHKLKYESISSNVHAARCQNNGCDYRVEEIHKLDANNECSSCGFILKENYVLLEKNSKVSNVMPSGDVSVSDKNNPINKEDLKASLNGEETVTTVLLSNTETKNLIVVSQAINEVHEERPNKEINLSFIEPDFSEYGSEKMAAEATLEALEGINNKSKVSLYWIKGYNASNKYDNANKATRKYTETMYDIISDRNQKLIANTVKANENDFEGELNKICQWDIFPNFMLDYPVPCENGVISSQRTWNCVLRGKMIMK